MASYNTESFKEELAHKASELTESPEYQQDLHKSVANDAAVLAASRSNEFAMAAEAGFPIPAETDDLFDMAKEKLSDTVDVAKENLSMATNYVASTIDLVSGVFISTKDRLVENMPSLPGNDENDVTGTTPDNSDKAFAQSEFKAELAEKADSLLNTEPHQYESHKLVAMDAAVKAASKTGDFAAVAEAGFPTINAKQDTDDVKAPSAEGQESLFLLARDRLDAVMASTNKALNSTVSTLEGAVGIARDTIGEGLEFIASKMSAPDVVTIGDVSSFRQSAMLGTEAPKVTVKINRPLGQPEFKAELAERAEEKMDSASYQWEEHKLVAKDAAIMAASKSSDFARAAALDPPSQPSASSASASASDGLIDTVSHAASSLQKATVSTLEDAVQGAKETFEEGMDFISEKMQAVGDVFSSSQSDLKRRQQQEYEMQQTATRLGLHPPYSMI
eukprot:TRINITY_DN6654_c1_g1_i2.p1 TRINITY_DN6654_c1_g1~~TRINITY_DN6654_c1_g1_i2.p1  ORF type:complete len:448 (-),score=114.11 TRINITY_DN6654_c1_g1_i2:74-1417(-)